jgi:cell division protein FtsW (lipid II flippase)
VVAATRSASQRGAVFERWPPNWPLALVALGVFIALFVVLINPRWRKYWWLVLIVGALVALLVLWLMRRA